MATMAGDTLSAGANRIVEIPGNGAAFCDNKVITSHYTTANFIPKNLMEQFSKPANCYFMFLVILQCLPEITTTGGMPTISLPLFIIVCLNAIKDFIEDWRRKKSDKLENDRLTLRAPKEAVSWHSLRVGDLVVVKNNEFIPADMVILASSHDEGHVFIETANLDGETNLKTKTAPSRLSRMLGQHKDYETAIKSASEMKGHIDCEAPNEFLYTFVGTMNVSLSGAAEKVPLDEDCVLLRGCKVKNVSWALGIAVYTGREAKIMMNSKEKRSRKMSHLEVTTGKFTGLVFLMQCLLCFIAALASAVFDTSESNLRRTYLNLTNENGEARNGFVIFIIRFFNFVILFANFIPISLLVSVAFVKLFQVFFMYNDKDMVYNDICCMPRTSDLNEEMGQVEYVFSDKTGTLTCNVMDFRKFCVDGTIYGEGITEIKRNVMAKMGQEVPDEPVRDPSEKRTPHVDLTDHRLRKLLDSRSGPQYEAVYNLLLHLAINHEVVPEVNEKDGTLTYSASSPDETALCYGARHFGFVFKSRTSDGMVVELEDPTSSTLLKVSILAILKFTSARKRSSVVVRYEITTQHGPTRTKQAIFTKGADSVIMERLLPSIRTSPSTSRTMDILQEFAEDGLRTLCLAGRELKSEELDRWLVRFNEASVATTDRQGALDQAADAIECNLELHGITGIEDRLQDQVGDTISKMVQAGIKVWMLTGDKIETAINIGVATSLLEPGSTERKDRPILTSGEFEVNGKFQAEDLCRKLKEYAEQARKVATLEGFVIDGKCLEHALEPENEMDFVAICRVCKTVICCRVSPKQKGAVVSLIKRVEKAITLAVGDGANDCNMIQSADVGVGIRGLEGLQAFNVCDYGISQFRFLQYLLLVHGRWCYRRVAILVCYTFYKNIVVVLPQYFLGFVSGFSGQKLYSDLMYQMFNVLHSMLPIVVFGVLDQDVSKQASLKYPELYKAGLNNEYMNIKTAAGWILNGVWHALVVFSVPYIVMSNGNVTHSDGKANDIWLVGSVVYLLVTLVVNSVALLETCFLSWLMILAIWSQLLFWFMEHGWLSGFATGSVITTELHGSTQRMFGSPMFYLVVITSLALALSVDIYAKGLRRSFFPTALHKVQDKILFEHPRKAW